MHEQSEYFAPVTLIFALRSVRRFQINRNGHEISYWRAPILNSFRNLFESLQGIPVSALLQPLSTLALRTFSEPHNGSSYEGLHLVRKDEVISNRDSSGFGSAVEATRSV